MENLHVTLICKTCGKEITDKGTNGGKRKFCSKECRFKSTSNKINSQNTGRILGLTTGEIGQICEKLVTIDLIKKGYKVYLPFDTTSKFDILAEKDGEYKRIQVKSGRINQNGEKMKIQVKHQEYDSLAIVYNLSEIVYDNENLVSLKISNQKDLLEYYKHKYRNEIVLQYQNFKNNHNN